MKTKELNYDFPKELIAKEPTSPRDMARLMVVDRNENKFEHSVFLELDKYLKSGDVLVFNKSKVFPARIYTKNKGKKIEVLFLEEVRAMKWEVMIGGKVDNGDVLNFGHDFSAIVIKDDKIFLEVSKTKNKVFDFLNKYGQTPLPPYIKRKANQKDKKNYQNIFADKVGSAAVPTAGLHFTQRLIDKLEKKGVQAEYVTLHVGLGTFAPVRTEELENHNIHTEYYEVDSRTAKRLSKAKRESRRIIACGTTTVRVLEIASGNGAVKAQKGRTNLFIYPGYNFKFVDVMITNFHTPKSSLLALVYAFGGQNLIEAAYQEAIKNEYRLFSYGDGMLIL